MRSAIVAMLGLFVAAAQPALAQHLSAPANIELTPNGQLLVASTGSNAIVTFQTDGSFVGSFGTGAGQPVGLALDRNQALFVAMRNNPDVSVYSAAGQLLRTVRNAAGVGIAVTASDYLVSLQANAAELFSPRGVLVHTITQDQQHRAYQGGAAAVIGTAMYYVSGPASGPSIADTVSVTSLLAGAPREREHFTNAGSPAPTQIAVDAKGDYYVAGGNGVVTVYSHFGVTMLTLSGLASPSGIAVDARNTIYVAERDANDIKVFDMKGRLLNTIR